MSLILSGSPFPSAVCLYLGTPRKQTPRQTWCKQYSWEVTTGVMAKVQNRWATPSGTQKRGGGVTESPVDHGQGSACDVKLSVSTCPLSDRRRGRGGVRMKGEDSRDRRGCREHPWTGSGQFSPQGQPPSSPVGPGQGRAWQRGEPIFFFFLLLKKSW